MVADVAVSYHPLAHGLEGERAEVGGGGVAVQFLDGTEGQPDPVLLGSRPAVLDVVAFRVLDVGQQQLVDGEAGSRRGTFRAPGGQTAGRRLPFDDDAGILGTAFGAVVATQQDVAAVAETVRQGDDGLA